MPIAIRSRSLLLAAVLVFATMGGAWAQDGEIPVELAPEAVAIAPCSLLAGGIEVNVLA